MKQWQDPEVLDQVRDFYWGLDEAGQEAFEATLVRLAAKGPTLGRPTAGEIDVREYSADIRGLFGKHLKELRPTSSMRVLFIFGPDRRPVLLVAGDKAGDWSRWYPTAIAEAAREYRAYLEDI